MVFLCSWVRPAFAKRSTLLLRCAPAHADVRLRQTCAAGRLELTSASGGYEPNEHHKKRRDDPFESSLSSVAGVRLELTTFGL
jgi:hypothetical protein